MFRGLLCLFAVSHLSHVVVTIETYEPVTNVQVHAFVSKVEPIKEQERKSSCDCYENTDDYFIVSECRCFGKEMVDVPEYLIGNVHRLTISESNMRTIKSDAFQPYKDSLRDITIGSLPRLRIIEKGAFRNIINLRTVYISHTPQLKSMYDAFSGITSTTFLTLRIIQTGLEEIPDLSYIYSEHVLHMIDLEGNKIERVPENSVKIKAHQVIFNHNQIVSVEDYAFNGSQIGQLSFRGNRQLTEVQTRAFTGLHNLAQLDLSDTAIEKLPIEGLSDLQVLKVENTPTMKTIPSVYDLINLKEAYLTHPFHCCAFKYPEQHDPEKHAQYESKIKKACLEITAGYDTGQLMPKNTRKKRFSIQEDMFEAIGYENKLGSPGELWTPNIEHTKGHPNKSDHSHLNPLRGTTIEHQEGKMLPPLETAGTFHGSSAEIQINTPVSAICGNLSNRKILIDCYPEPNALNPCEDMMGSDWLRISVWFVIVLAVVGNLAVIVVILFSGGEITVSRFLMCNLAFADLCMGMYLLLIASMDLHSIGTYFNFAFDWQYGLGCQCAGFLTVFASQLSIFTLTIVTVERWFAIAYAIYLTRRIRLKVATKIMACGWMYSILMAALPVFGVSNYSSTSICLPMEVNRTADKAYLITLIIINGLAFVLIVFCYAQIYLSLTYETRHTKGETKIAKKMALLVFTDFACWAPIAFFGLTALAGYPLIGVTRSKILLVFFYPLNSCANPYLYAIMTAQYRKDLLVLLSRCGIFKNTAKQYVLSTSLPTTNNTHPVPLVTKTNGQKNSTRTSEKIEDAFV